MEGRLANKVAMVTGAGSGMGAAIAKRFAKEGARIVICDIREEAMANTAAACPEGSVLQVIADIRKIEDTQAMTDAAIKFGGKIDILANVAGITSRGAVADVTLEEWNNVISTNLFGAFYMMRAVLPHMIEAQAGSIITISSLAGIRRIPSSTAYSTSKAGLIGLAQSVAYDYGKYNIRSNIICPGLTRTESVDRHTGERAESLGMDKEAAFSEMMRLSPIHRPISTDEIASTALFFASDESATITGAVLSADSGTAICDASIGAMRSVH